MKTFAALAFPLGWLAWLHDVRGLYCTIVIGACVLAWELLGVKK